MRPSLRAIATAAGVSVSTASIALRDLAKVDEATRARVKETAERLGYVRDPQLAGALAFARRRDKPVYRETLGFLADMPPGAYGRMDWLQELHEGVCDAATAQGYRVECFGYPNTARDQRALGRKMKARGIRGLVITPALQRGLFTLDMDWGPFVPIEIGQTLIEPSLPHIVHDTADDYAAMFEELATRGYRRIGFSITRHDERRRHWAMMSAYLVFQYKNPGLPALKPVESPFTYWESEQLAAWFAREKPDVIVTNGPRLGKWLAEIGRRVPEDVGLCRIDAMHGPDSGLRPDYAGMGRMAVESLVPMLERSGASRPMIPSLLCIPNRWFEGKTLRPRPPDAPPATLPAA